MIDIKVTTGKGKPTTWKTIQMLIFLNLEKKILYK